LFIGRFHKLKGLDLLIDAFQYIDDPNIQLVISGVDYGSEGDLRALSNKLGLKNRVHWTPPLYGMRKLKALVQADVLVMPSRYEMWGIVFMESLACGTPVIMTDTCEASKVLLPECGRVVPFEPKRLASAIKALVNLGFVYMYRNYRKEWVSQYSWEKMAPRVLNLYLEVLNGH